MSEKIQLFKLETTQNGGRIVFDAGSVAESTLTLPKFEFEKFKAWFDAHECRACTQYTGSFTPMHVKFQVTPTGIGACYEAKCICGDSVDMTDYESM